MHPIIKTLVSNIVNEAQKYNVYDDITVDIIEGNNSVQIYITAANKKIMDIVLNLHNN